jgi:hypothetical protein
MACYRNSFTFFTLSPITAKRWHWERISTFGTRKENWGIGKMCTQFYCWEMLQRLPRKRWQSLPDCKASHPKRKLPTFEGTSSSHAPPINCTLRTPLLPFLSSLVSSFFSLFLIYLWMLLPFRLLPSLLPSYRLHVFSTSLWFSLCSLYLPPLSFLHFSLLSLYITA